MALREGMKVRVTREVRRTALDDGVPMVVATHGMILTVSGQGMVPGSWYMSIPGSPDWVEVDEGDVEPI